MADSNAVLNLIGKDSGLAAVLANATKGLTGLTSATLEGTASLADYAAGALSIGDALSTTTNIARSAVGSIDDVAVATSGAYRTIINNSERTIKVADVLDNTFAKLALNISGLGGQTESVNSVLQPTAGFFSEVANESNAVGKAFTIINTLEKPLVGGLKAASNVAGGLANALSSLGGAGGFAAAGLTSVAAGAANLAGIVGSVDTLGDFYKTLEQIQEVAPGIAAALGEVGLAAASTTGNFLSLTNASTETFIAAQALSTFGKGLAKDLGAAYISLANLKTQLGFIVGMFNTVANTAVAASLQLRDFSKGLEGIKNLGFDSYSTELVSSLGLIGENLLFNTQASKEFSSAAVAAFAKVEDSISFITTLPAGTNAGIPRLSKQLSDLVNGPLQNAITKGEAAAAMYQSLSAGIGAAAGKIKESGPFLEAALKLASGTETQAATTVETLAKVSYAYNLNVKEATKTAAKLSGVVEEGIITFPQLAGGIGRVAGVAAQAKVPLNEMLGSVAALTKTMSGDDAMTGYMSLLNSIAGAGDQAQKSAAELGVQFDLQAVKAKGLLNVLQDLWKKSGGNIAKIKEIIPDSLAYGTALTLMTTAFQEAKEKSEIISKKTGDELETLFGARQQSLIKQTTALVNGFDEVLADFGEQFAEKFKPSLQIFREILERFKNLPEPIRNSIGAIISFNAAIDKGAGFINILLGGVKQIAISLAVMRLIAIGLSRDLQKEFLGSLKNIFDALRTGEGRVAAVQKAFENFAGISKTQTQVNNVLATSQNALGKVNQALRTDLTALAKGYAENAIAAQKAAIAQDYLAVKLQNTGQAVNAIPIRMNRAESFIRNLLGIPSVEQVANEQAQKFTNAFVKEANAYADQVVGRFTFFDKVKIIGIKAFSDLGKAFDALALNLIGINSSTLKTASVMMQSKAATEAATGAIVLYNAEFAKTQVANGSFKKLAESFLVFKNQATETATGTAVLGRSINFANLRSIDWLATIKQLPANLGKLFTAINTVRTATEQVILAQTIAAQIEAGLILPTTTLSAAMGILGNTVLAAWASFGPLILILGTAAVAMQAVGEVVGFNILGFKSAAAESQEYAANLVKLSDNVEELSVSLDKENKQLEKNSLSYKARIQDLKKLRESTSDSGEKKELDSQIKKLEEFERQLKRTEDKKYTGFMNTFLIPATEGLAKFLARLTPLQLMMEKTNNTIEDFFRNNKENWQSLIDDVNGVTAAMQESQRQTDVLFQAAINRAQILKQGSAITKEAQDILALAKTRKVTAEELTTIEKKETAAYEANKKAIDDRVNILQEALKTEKDPERRRVHQRNIDDLNKGIQTYDNYRKALQGFILANNDFKDAILGNQGVTVKLKEIREQQEKLIASLPEKIKASKDDQEKALLENQDVVAKGNLKVIDEVGKGMFASGELQKKQLNSLLASYKEFADNATRTSIGVTFQDLNTQRQEIDKFLQNLETNLDNLSGKAAENLIQTVLDQKIRLEKADLAGSIVSPEQLQRALDLVKTIYDKSAQERIDSNTRTINAINNLQELGIRRQTLAQKQVLEYEIKNDQASLESKQKYLKYAEPVIGRESTIYKRLRDEITAIAVGIEQKKTKVLEAGISDREKLNARGIDRESALLESSYTNRLTLEDKYQEKLFQTKQKQNLQDRRTLIERINALKSRGGDFTELETQLIQKQTEFEKNILSNEARNTDRRKQQLANAKNSVSREYENQSNTLDFINKQLQRQQDLLTSRGNLIQSEGSNTQSRLEMQKRLTGDIQKLADIDYEQATAKLKLLESTQKTEREGLKLQQQQQKASLEKEAIANRLAKLENDRAIAALKLDLIQARRENRSKEEIQSLKTQLLTLLDQNRLLNSQTQELDAAKRNQAEISKNTELELLARQKIAQEGGVLDQYLAKVQQGLAVYRKQQETAENYAKFIEIQSVKETNKAESLTKIYERQSSVLEAQKTAIESRSNRLTSQLEIVKQLTISDLKQRDLAQTIAQIKYRTLIQQQSMEKKVLDLQILQNQAALEKEKIQLRVQQAQNKADVLGAYAELQTTLATPTATDAQKYAAQLNLQAKLEQGASLKFQEAQLPDREKLQSYLDASQRQNLTDQQMSARDSAKMEIINNLAPVDRALAIRQFRAEKVGQLLGVRYDRSNEGDVFQALRKGNKNELANIFGGRELSDRAFNYGYSNPGYTLTPRVAPDQTTAPDFNSVDYEEVRRNFLAQMQEFTVPGVKLPPPPQLQNPPALGGQRGRGAEGQGGRGAGEMKSITVERVVIEQVNVEVNSDASPQDAAKEVRNAIMDELYNLGTKVKTKL